jgi:hypothetical protein
MTGFFMLMAQQHASSPEESSVRKQLSWASGDSAEEAARVSAGKRVRRVSDCADGNYG